MIFKSLSIYCKTNILKIGLYGFVCGMSLLLSGNTINFWLASSDIDPKIIGLFALITAPYIFKFLIAIFIAHQRILWLSNKIGHYKSWLILAQVMLAISLVGASFLSPKQDLWLIALSGLLIALFAVIQDIIFNANRINILDVKSQPAGAVTYTIGYRLGMLCSGAGVIFASANINWQAIYLILAGIYAFFMMVTLCCYQEETQDHQVLKLVKNASSWYKNLIEPLQAFMISRNFIWIISFIFLYRLADHMLIIMLNPFLLQLGYDAREIASISKFFGVIMAIIGGIVSGLVITRISIRRSLVAFSVMHIFGHLFFILLSIIGKNIALLYFITAYEALTGGMMMTVYLSFISGLCKGKHTATQYALLSSGIGLSRVFLPATSGIIVDAFGWVMFFVIIVFISTITTIFTYLMPRRLF